MKRLPFMFFSKAHLNYLLKLALSLSLSSSRRKVVLLPQADPFDITRYSGKLSMGNLNP
jgi:hypothetical protein